MSEALGVIRCTTTMAVSSIPNGGWVVCVAPLQSKKKRIAEFKRFPRMARFYIRGIKEYIATHPNGKMVQKTGGNAYDWFTSQVFCDGWGEFVERFGRSELFDDKIDTKKYLENEFNIEL